MSRRIATLLFALLLAAPLLAEAPPRRFDISLGAFSPRLSTLVRLDSANGLVGAELDEPEFVDVIESQGAAVVADRLCFGARSVLDPIDENAADPLEAIARAYFFRPSCARMIGDFPARFDALERLLAEARADGVIFERLTFCDPWGADQHNLSMRSKQEGAFPILFVSREYGIVPTGQLRTRPPRARGRSYWVTW